MRVLRTILGLLLLIIGLPALLVGAGFWAALQHRDPGGAFSGDLQRTVTSGYAVVVADADGLLRTDAPFARAGDTTLRLTAYTLDGPAFIGIGPADDVARYLDDVPRQVVTAVDLGTGALPVATERIGGPRAPASVPDRQSFWLKSATGGLDWHPSALRGRHYSLVIMTPSAQPGLEVTATAELSPGWLNSATWSLLLLGSLLVMAGIVVLAWPGRRREVIYVVEPSQVPDLMVAIGAPLPLSRTGGGRHAGTHRPRTLADAGTKSAQRALPPLAWPPSQSGTANAPVSPGIGASVRQIASASPMVTAAGPAAGPPAGPPAAPLAGPPAAPAAGPPAAPAASPPAAPAAKPPSPSEYAAATAIPGATRGTGQRTPPPGQPLSLIGGMPSKGVPLSSSSPASAAVADEAAADGSAERIGRRRVMVPDSDTPVFEATAVGAWVAETAAARARETEARAAAVLAAEAAKRGAVKGAAKEDAAALDKGDAKPAAAEASKPPTTSGHASDATVPTGLPAGPAVPTGRAVAGSASEGWSATGLRRAESPRLGFPGTDGPDASHASVAGDAKTPTAAPVQPAKGENTAPENKAAAERAAKAPTNGDRTPLSAAKDAPAAEGSSDSGENGAAPAKPSPKPAEAAGASGPELTAPAPARPTAPNRPTVPAPARPAPPSRPTPDPTPSRPAAESLAVSQPAAKAPAAVQPAATVPAAVQPAASAPAGAQPPVAAPAARVATGGHAKSGRPAGPVTHPNGGQSQAPVHVSISDRPAVVSQPGSSIPGGTSEPPAGVAPRPAAEMPHTTAEIQARLQAAMKSSTRLSGEPRTTAGSPIVPAGSPTAVTSPTAVSSPTAAAAPGPASSTDAVRVGVAGRRDYPASARRDDTDATRSVRTGRPAGTSATRGPEPKAGEDAAEAAKSGNHIAEQRVDSGQPRVDSASTDIGKERTRRAVGRATKADRTNSATPESAPSVPGARLSAYAEEAAELLAGVSPNRRRRKRDGAANPVKGAEKESAED